MQNFISFFSKQMWKDVCISAHLSLFDSVSVHFKLQTRLDLILEAPNSKLEQCLNVSLIVTDILF